MSAQWQQYDHHDTLQCKLTESEQAELIKAYDAFYSRLDSDTEYKESDNEQNT